MIQYHRHVLDNGLRVITHTDPSTPLCAVNVLYDVGSRDESPEMTGFAHLFEHLMFGGSAGAESYDDPIQNAGGECNAFTNSDLTNFFSLLPSKNLELALYLEADRMHRLLINKQSLEIQRSVVTEEFKETCLNRPYGDLWHILAPLAYTEHPYQWPTIGREIEHIRQAQLADVQDFYAQFYGPNNAVLGVSGNFSDDQVMCLVEKYFGRIEYRPRPTRSFPPEPVQTVARRKRHTAHVPVDALNMAFHMGGRLDSDYYTSDLLSDVLGSGKSSRLYQALVKDKAICTEADAFITGAMDPGLFVVEAKPAEGASLEQIEAEVWSMLDELKNGRIEQAELQKHKNKIESSIHFANTSVLNKTMNLAYFELIDRPGLINDELDQYALLNTQSLTTCAEQLFQPENSNVLHYLSDTSDMPQTAEVQTMHSDS